ncbi:MAG: hypothetical protein IKX62_03215 [Bacteroidales bacterium]|nr:hypothetical protein [Bacteroidales bacterium]
MNELESYIRAHAAQFDAAEPAAGHEERFLARLDAVAPARSAARTGQQPFRSRILSFRAKSRNLLFTRPVRFFAYALAVCAAVLLILRPGDPWRGAGNDPQQIYLAYMDRVAELYRVPSEDSEARDALLQEITEEEDPLFTQLPEELSRRERGRILKDYYGRMLAAASEIK